MEDQKKFNFIRHVSPAASKKYILKILFYVAFLGALIYMIFSQTNKNQEIVIKGVRIDTEIQDVQNID